MLAGILLGPCVVGWGEGEGPSGRRLAGATQEGQLMTRGCVAVRARPHEHFPAAHTSAVRACSTALGRIPHFSDTLFPASSLGVIKTIADFALIFFMCV